MNPRTKTIFAPGKLMIVGDWSVLYPGNTSVSFAVHRGMHVSISPQDFYSVQMPDIGFNTVPFSIQEGKVSFEKTLPEYIFFESALNTFLQYTERDVLSPVSITISSSISRVEGAYEKIGFGSSASLTVALIAAFSRFYGYEFEKEVIYKMSYAAHYAAQRGAGSGFDIATSVFGGCISYSMPDVEKIPKAGGLWDIDAEWPGLKIEKIDIPIQNILIGYSGKGSSTKELIMKMKAFEKSHAGYLEDMIGALNSHVLAFIKYMQLNDCEDAIQAVRQIRTLFKELQQKSDLEFETPRITKMCDYAEDLGGAAKFSGAGGGDSVIAFGCSNTVLKEVYRAWKDFGVDSIDVQLDSAGVREILS